MITPDEELLLKKEAEEWAAAYFSDGKYQQLQATRDVITKVRDFAHYRALLNQRYDQSFKDVKVYTEIIPPGCLEKYGWYHSDYMWVYKRRFRVWGPQGYRYTMDLFRARREKHLLASIKGRVHIRPGQFRKHRCPTPKGGCMYCKNLDRLKKS